MTRSEVAERADVGSETVRYYERRGLIPEPPRSSGGYRLYDDAYVHRLRFIGRAQELGFTLREIKDLLDLRLEPKANRDEVRALAEEKLLDVEAKIRDLQRIETVLSHLVQTCQSEEASDACRILHALGQDDSSRQSTSEVSAPAIQLQAVITCPACGQRHAETMPEDACQFFWECPACHAVARPAGGDCCVYCSYADVPCPPVQRQENDGHTTCCSSS